MTDLKPRIPVKTYPGINEKPIAHTIQRYSAITIAYATRIDELIHNPGGWFGVECSGGNGTNVRRAIAQIAKGLGYHVEFYRAQNNNLIVHKLTLLAPPKKVSDE